MKKKKSSHVFRGAANIFLSLLVILMVVSQVANSWAGMVNGFLGVSDESIVRSGDPADYRFRSDFENPSDLIQAEIDLNTRLAAEGAVALKGRPELGGTQVTLFGMRSGEKMQFGGSMGELTDSSCTVTLAEAMAANGFSVNPDMVEFYKKQAAAYAPGRASGGNVVSSYEGQGSAVGEVPVTEYNAADIGSYRDAAVVVFGRDAGESCCFYPGIRGLANPAEFTDSPTGNILSLSNDERDMLNWVKAQGFAKIVVLLNSSGAMEIDELKNDDAIDSIVWIGNPGAYGTYGIAKLLSGEVLPSGHLPDTFAVNSALSPAAQNYGIYTFANAGEIDTSANHALRGEWYLVEAESVYLGYKYYETRYFDSVAGQGNASTAQKGETVDGGGNWNYYREVSYSFGYGIEGSEFTEEITDVNIDWSGEADSAVTVRVYNVGDRAAKHAVQLYVSLPYTDNDRKNGVEKSAIQLVGYAKTGEAAEGSYAETVLLEPGAFEDVTITFNAQDLYSYDMRYQHDNVSGAYVLEAGEYYFATGNGAHDAVQAVLREMYPGKEGLEPTGVVYKEKLSMDTYLTQLGGETVRNRLDGADLNKLGTGTTVTYLSRSNWAATFPESVEGVRATEEMIYMLRNATYNEEVARSGYDGPSAFTYGADNGVIAADLIGLAYDDPKYDAILDEMTLEDLVKQYLANLSAINSIIYPKENPSDSPLGLIATIGQRTGGSIYELSQDDPAHGRPTDVYVGEPVVAATFSPLLQEEEGRLVANDALWTGFSTWFGPGMNLHRTPYNGRNLGYYSEDSVLTGLAATYVHRGLGEKGVMTNAKHFAFNDQETNREGIAVFLSEQAARENELRAFQIPIRDGALKGLMSAFNRIGCTHVGASSGLMNGILRGEWGFKGFLITDSVKSAQYFLPKECLMAGNDMMLGGSNNGETWNFTEQAVGRDPVLQAALRESFHRKLYFYINSVLMNGITADSQARNAAPWWVTMLQVLGGLCFIGFAAFLALHILQTRREMAGPAERRNEAERMAGVATLVLAVAALVLFGLSYTTGYFIFGQMKSGLITLLLSAAIAASLIALAARWMFPDAFWTKLLTFVVTALLASAAMLLVGDRVEAIGNCVVTDFDSGHGGEEAVYLSIAASALMLIAMVYNIIGSFAGEKSTVKELSREKTKLIRVGFGVSAAALLAAVLIPTVNLVHKGSGNAEANGGYVEKDGGVYKVTFNQANGNVEDVPGYQFLCGSFGGMLWADSRMFLDVTLTLKEDGKYSLFSEVYVVEGDYRAEIGDDTGLGMVITMSAEGTYEDNADGTVKTSVPTHAVFTVQTDTYSSQMKGAVGLDVDGSSDDGVYDSDEIPAVLERVPETIWTLGGGAIRTWRDANAGGAYMASFNQNNGNMEGLPDYQFLGCNFGGLLWADSRMFLDVTLTLDGDGGYSLFSEAYVVEGAARAQIGDDSGLGMVLNMNASGSYVENDDGTYTTDVPVHAVFEMQTDIYSSQMKGAVGLGVAGNSDDGIYDSDSVPAVLEFVPRTTWTLGEDGTVISWMNPDAGSDEPEEGTDADGQEGGDASAEGLAITSDDGATTFTFYADGTYVFAFPAYGIEDAGTYSYDGTTLTITNASGAEATAQGDPLKFHYVASMSDQLTGDFTVGAEENLWKQELQD